MLCPFIEKSMPFPFPIFFKIDTIIDLTESINCNLFQLSASNCSKVMAI